MAKPRSNAPQVNRKPAATKGAEAQTTPVIGQGKGLDRVLRCRRRRPAVREHERAGGHGC